MFTIVSLIYGMTVARKKWVTTQSLRVEASWEKQCSSPFWAACIMYMFQIYHWHIWPDCLCQWFCSFLMSADSESVICFLTLHNCVRYTYSRTLWSSSHLCHPQWMVEALPSEFGRTTLEFLHSICTWISSLASISFQYSFPSLVCSSWGFGTVWLMLCSH